MERLIASLGKTVYFDANIVVYAVEGYTPLEGPLRAVLEAVDGGRLRAVTSELTLAEVLVKPKMDGDTRLVGAYCRFLDSTALELVSVSRNILTTAAELRANSKLKLPDAIHVASALESECNAFLTNDRALKVTDAIPVVYLSDFHVS